MINAKYEFVEGDFKVIAPGRTVKRIRALVAIASMGVSTGALGGYVEAEANLQVYGDAWVYGNASLLMIGPIGSRRAGLTVHADAKIGIRFSTGCFTGTRDEFWAAVSKTHGDNEHGNAYAAALMLADVAVKGCEAEALKEAA